jgi:hypothetical protein
MYARLPHSHDEQDLGDSHLNSTTRALGGVMLLTCAALLAAVPATGSTLFEDQAVLDVTLAGPLTTVIDQKQDRDEHPFRIDIGGNSYDVAVRVRGNSRVTACAFPPLRLNFHKSDLDNTPLDGEDKLKLVTHCSNGSERGQDSVLNEFAAYRIFNEMSAWSYRVRLLRIRYEDTDGKQRKLDEPHYGFLIESNEQLANRLDGAPAEVEGVVFSSLDTQQTARLSVFQYLIGNRDWSFVTAESDDSCCHNIDLFRVDGALVPVPYDFDLAALTRAKYRAGARMAQSHGREYSGYCRQPEESLVLALDHVQALRDDIVAAAEGVPSLGKRAGKRRVDFVRAYFEEADDRERLLTRFQRDCIGKR